MPLLITSQIQQLGNVLLEDKLFLHLAVYKTSKQSSKWRRIYTGEISQGKNLLVYTTHLRERRVVIYTEGFDRKAGQY